jgi:hypothetical protein
MVAMDDATTIALALGFTAFAAGAFRLVQRALHIARHGTEEEQAAEFQGKPAFHR